MHIECPTCKTRYDPLRLGMHLGGKTDLNATVKCLVCASVFDVHVASQLVQSGWRDLFQGEPTYEFVSTSQLRK